MPFLQIQMSGDDGDAFQLGDYKFSSEAMKSARGRIRELEYQAQVSYPVTDILSRDHFQWIRCFAL